MSSGRASRRSGWNAKCRALVAGCLVTGLMGGLPAWGDSAHEQFVFAYKLLQRGDTAEAAAEFDRYLQDYPAAAKRTDAAYYRALLHRESGDARSAAVLLGGVDAEAAALVPAYAVRLLHGQALVDARRYGEALAVLGDVEADRLDDGLGLAVRYLRGQAARSAGEAGLAVQEFRAAADLAERTGNALLGPVLVELAESERGRGDWASAGEALGRALAVADGAPLGVRSAGWVAQAARLLGDVSYEAGEYDAAARAYRRVIEGFPGSEHYGPAAVGTLWAWYASEQDERLLEAYGQWVDTLPMQDRLAAAYLAGSAEQRRGRHEAAVALLEPVSRGEGTLTLEERVLYRLAVSYHALGRDAEVLATEARLGRLFPESALRADAAFLSASSRSRMGDAVAGVAALTRFVDAGPSGPYFFRALRQRAGLYEAQGALDAALADYGAYFQALSERPSGEVDDAAEIPVLWRYGDALTRAGKLEAAKAQFGGALMVLQERRERGEALVALEPEAWLRAGSAFAAAGDDARALAVFEELAELHPVHALAGEAALKRGAVLQRLGRGGEALSAWIEAAQSEGLSSQQRGLALRAAAGVYRSAGRGGDAAVTLGQAVAVAGVDFLTNDELLWLAGQRLSAAGDRATVDADAAVAERGDGVDATAPLLSEAERLLAALDAAGRDLTAGQRSHRLYLGGKLALRLGDFEQAGERFGRVLALSEGFDLDAQLGLAEVAEARGDLDAARAEYDALTRAPETQVAAWAMLRLGRVEATRAVSLARQGRDREVIDAQAAARRVWKRLALLYLDAEQVQPAPQEALVALGELAESMDESAVAAREYGQLAEQFPRSDWGRYASAVLAGRYEGRADDALATLRGLVDRGDRDALAPGLAGRVEALRASLEDRP